MNHSDDTGKKPIKLKPIVPKSPPAWTEEELKARKAVKSAEKKAKIEGERKQSQLNKLAKAKPPQSKNKKEGVEYFVSQTLKKYYNKGMIVVQFERIYQIEEGSIVSYLAQMGIKCHGGDLFTEEIASKMGKQLYEIHLDRKKQQSEREAYYATTKNRLPKTKPNYYKLIFTR